MELVFLGTGAGKPTPSRNVTSIVLNLMAERGTLWFFDSGEATQHQLMRTDLSLARLEMVFITHLHGDHIFGLPGLLTSRSLMMNMKPVTLFGPKGIKRFIETVIDISDSTLTYPLRIVEIEHEGILFQDAQFTIEVKKLAHRIECYGYRVTQADKMGRLDVERLKADNIPIGTHYSNLKNGETVDLNDGRRIRGLDYLDDPVKGKTVVILGDTAPSPATIELAMYADVLVHEATQGADLIEKANIRGHSTTVQAAEIAQKSQVKKLIVTHISPRYSPYDNQKLLCECRAVFPATDIATDLSVFSID